MKNHQVLLAEDDFDFGSILKQYLEIHNFDVTWCKDGEEARDAFAKAYSDGNLFDICVLDVMMPKMDGFTLAEKVIEIDPEVPFIFLTARKMKEDRIQGLKLGADDYIVKPFEADILVLRLNNILKRSQRDRQIVTVANNKSTSVYAIGNYHFDAQNHTLTLGETVQSLTEKEALLIHFFYENKNQMLRREDILTKIWGNDDFFSGRSMDVFISRLRKYFKDDPAISIASTRGVGLTFKLLPA
ncbi:DNA-binding response regulator [Dokdonia sinensis]|uniref:DNA-binding response regulator n=1 Tax=Dokdonia sinensis TaxID=2479847 RepID=A0A3M0FYS6_9FLAO|nr:response regulator transcription factor [Dokdonia sinensis]RMB57638.1 DNA-binding response regulator [Dokdonia sinensis]